MASKPSWHRPQVDIIESMDIIDEETMQLLLSSQKPRSNNVVTETIDITDDDVMLLPSRELHHDNVVTQSIDITDDDTIMIPSSQEQTPYNESDDINKDTVPLPPPSREPIHSDVIDITCETQDESDLNLKPTAMFPLQPTLLLQESPSVKEKTSSTSPLTPATETKVSTSKIPVSHLTALPSTSVRLPRETSISLEPPTFRIRETPQISKVPTTSYTQPLVEVVDCFKNSQHNQKSRSQTSQQKILDEAKILAQLIIDSVYKETEGVNSQGVSNNAGLFNMTNVNSAKNVSKNVSKSKTKISKPKRNNKILNHKTKKADLQNNVNLVGSIVKSPESDPEVTNKVNRVIDTTGNYGMVGMTIQSMNDENNKNESTILKLGEEKYSKCKKKPKSNAVIKEMKDKQRKKITENKMCMERDIILPINLPNIPSGLTVTKVKATNENHNYVKKAITTQKSEVNLNKIIENRIYDNKFQDKNLSATSSIYVTKYTGTDMDLRPKTSEIEDITQTRSIFEVSPHKDPVEKTECSLEIERSVVNSKSNENNSTHDVTTQENSNLKFNKNYLMTDNCSSMKVQNLSMNIDMNYNNTSARLINGSNENPEINENLILKDTYLTMSQNLSTTSGKKHQEERIGITETNSRLGQLPITVVTQHSETGLKNNMIPITAIYNHLLTLGIKAVQKPHRSQYEKQKPKPIGKKNIIGKNLHRKPYHTIPNNNLRKKKTKTTQGDKCSKSDSKYWRTVFQHYLMNTNNFPSDGYNPLNSVEVNPFYSPNHNALLHQQHVFNLSNSKAPPQQQNNFQSPSHKPLLPRQPVFQLSSHVAKLQQQNSFDSQSHRSSVPQQHVLKSSNHGASLQQQNPYKSPSREVVQQQVFHSTNQVPAPQQHPVNSSNANALAQQYACQSPSRDTTLRQQYPFNSLNCNEPLQLQNNFETPSIEQFLQQKNVFQSPSREAPLQHSKQQHVYKSPSHEPPLKNVQQQPIFKSPSYEGLLKHLQQQQVYNLPNHESSVQQKYIFNSPTRKESNQREHVSPSPSRTAHLEQEHLFNSPSREATLKYQNADGAPKYQPLLHQEYAYKSPNHQIPFQQVHRNKPLFHETALQQDCIGKLTHKTSLQEQVNKSPKYQTLLHQDLAYKSTGHETLKREHSITSSSHQALLPQEHASTSKQQVPLHLEDSNIYQSLFNPNKSPRRIAHLQHHNTNNPLNYDALMPQRQPDLNSQYQAFLRHTLSPKSHLDHQLNYLYSQMLIGGVPNLTAIDYQKKFQDAAELIQSGLVNDFQKGHESANTSDTNSQIGNNAFTAPKCPSSQLPSASTRIHNVSKSSTGVGHKRSLSSETLEQETFGTKCYKRNRSADDDQ